MKLIVKLYYKVFKMSAKYSMSKLERLMETAKEQGITITKMTAKVSVVLLMMLLVSCATTKSRGLHSKYSVKASNSYRSGKSKTYKYKNSCKVTHSKDGMHLRIAN